jgi:hypothetical protein
MDWTTPCRISFLEGFTRNSGNGDDTGARRGAGLRESRPSPHDPRPIPDDRGADNG